ncbi:putative IQ motif, EF-hand binding protein [Helianthus debilis subsp. tardiflorus]
MNEQSKHAYSVAYATIVAAEVAVAAAHAAAEVVRLTSITHPSSKSAEEMVATKIHPSSKSAEEMVATKIQTAYRRHLASRALRPLRGLGRLRSVIQGQSVKRQTTSALKCFGQGVCVESLKKKRKPVYEGNRGLIPKVHDCCSYAYKNHECEYYTKCTT